MAAPKRYADGTTVPVERSQAEIAGILRRHGVLRQAWTSEPEGDSLHFELEGGSYRVRIDRPTVDQVRERDSGLYTYPHNVDWTAKANAEWIRRWRATVLLLKAKLEFADGDTTTVARELLAYALLPNGTTLGDAIAAGTVPLLTSGGKK